ncbi:hypothetical protein I3843_10G077900 [Carya illinoinensis]|nr:hypothetical protein I3843_10G077900 [Carya illinoinensis]
MGEKVCEYTVTTIMVLKVDLQCDRCYKKVKKVLYKFPQIQDQIFDEKQNTVLIKVVCCSPEKVKQKIIYKGGNSIQSIEIKPPPKPKTEEAKPKPQDPKPAEKPKEAAQKPKENPAANPKPAEKPKEAEAKPKGKPDDAKPPEPVPKPSEPAALIAVPYYPQTYVAGAYSRPLYEGYGGGPLPSCEEYAIGRPVYDSYGGGGYWPPSYVNRYDYYSSEENQSGCIIM